MRILICHNFYQQAGGEDQVFAAEAELLRKHGHDVQTFSLHNDSIETMGKLQLARATLWNRDSAAQVRSYVRGHRAQVVHFHNTFPLLSPSVYWSARAEGAAVVQTLHNYRMLCPAATFFRDGKPCEKCLGHAPLAAVIHKCYRGSLPASAISSAALMMHRAMGTYKFAIDAYIALTNFAREKFLAGGFPVDRLHLKPNFIDPDPGPGTGDGQYALFVGRLAEEKGVEPLLKAWETIGNSLPLKIVGDGPLAARVKPLVDPNIHYLGRQPFSKVIDLMGKAVMLVFPSLWYEGFPRTIVEAFARGTPVAASNLGSMKELVQPGRNGILFQPNDPADMAAKILPLAGDGPLLSSMRQAARADFVNHFGAEQNHDILLDIYRKAIETREALGNLQEAEVQVESNRLAPG
jgi:glycosyltransferase involved in cell wall biosynthesis